MSYRLYDMKNYIISPKLELSVSPSFFSGLVLSTDGTIPYFYGLYLIISLISPLLVETWEWVIWFWLCFFFLLFFFFFRDDFILSFIYTIIQFYTTYFKPLLSCNTWLLTCDVILQTSLQQLQWLSTKPEATNYDFQ